MPGNTLSVASWNVEHFKAKPDDPSHQARLNRVVDLLSEKDSGTGQGGPDVFAIIEVTGAEVFGTPTAHMPDYNFAGRASS